MIEQADQRRRGVNNESTQFTKAIEVAPVIQTDNKVLRSVVLVGQFTNLVVLLIRKHRNNGFSVSRFELVQRVQADIRAQVDVNVRALPHLFDRRGVPGRDLDLPPVCT